MEKRSLQLKYCFNREIQVGDKVKFKDGSGISCDGFEKDIYIIFNYEELTGSISDLKDIEFTVVSTNVSDRVVPGVCGKAYVQDLELVSPIGKTFRTPSGFVSIN